MEPDDYALSNLVHRLIQKFIILLDKCMEQLNIDKNKVFAEIIKRSISISQEILSIGRSILAFETAGKLATDEMLHKKIQNLLETLLKQDLIECALNYASAGKDLTHKDLHECLYFGSLNDISSMTQSHEHLLDSVHLSPLPPLLVSAKEFETVLLSLQFEKNKLIFDEEYSQIKSVFSGISPSDESQFTKSDSQISCGNARAPQEDSWLWLSAPSERTLDFQTFSGMTWEGRMKQYIPCHLYSSELAGDEARHNVTDGDPHPFRSLHERNLVVSQEIMRHDILDMLVGIPSTSFSYDENQKEFVLSGHVRMRSVSHESTLNSLRRFMDCGSTFKRLSLFASQTSPHEGCVLRGVKSGIHQVLKVYTEYMVAVKIRKPSVDFLRKDVMEAAEALNILGAIASDALPKGLGLLAHLNRELWPHRRGESAPLIALVMKHAYAPYLNFLDQWMEEGICFDPHKEFQIVENLEYLDRRDELYWKFAYTENSENVMRAVPHEMNSFSRDILQCGKNTGLLKICGSQVHTGVPALTLVFSYHGACTLADTCALYMQEEERQGAEDRDCRVTEDELLLGAQATISRREIQNAMKQNYSFRNLAELEWGSKKSHVIRKWKSSENIVHMPSAHSDIVFSAVGMLFSCCDLKSELHDFLPRLSSSPHKELSCHDRAQNSRSFLSQNKSEDESRVNESQRSFPARYLREFSFTKNLFSSDFWEGEVDGRRSSSPQHAKELFSRASGHIAPGTFMGNLARELVSGAEEVRDVCSCLQLSSLQSILLHSLKPVLDARMHVVKRAVMDYFMNHLRLQDLLGCLRATYLLLDESFSQSMSEQLFAWTLKSKTMDEFCNWSVLNEIFCSSFSEATCSKYPLLSTGSVVIVDLPHTDLLDRTEYLNLFQFQFKVVWPLNIVVHEERIADYMSALPSLLKMDFLCWLLGRVWRKSMCHQKAKDLQNSSQFKDIMLKRFDMHQFLSALRHCIRHDLHGPVWDFLSKKLSTEELSIDALEDIHARYMHKVLTRCFLTPETKLLRELLTVVQRSVYRFCTWALECAWELNPDTRQYETLAFQDVMSAFDTYKKYKKAFYDYICRLTAKESRCTRDGFQQFLEIILESRRGPLQNITRLP